MFGCFWQEALAREKDPCQTIPALSGSGRSSSGEFPYHPTRLFRAAAAPVILRLPCVRVPRVGRRKASASETAVLAPGNSLVAPGLSGPKYPPSANRVSLIAHPRMRNRATPCGVCIYALSNLPPFVGLSPRLRPHPADRFLHNGVRPSSRRLVRCSRAVHRTPLAPKTCLLQRPGTNNSIQNNDPKLTVPYSRNLPATIHCSAMPRSSRNWRMNYRRVSILRAMATC